MFKTVGAQLRCKHYDKVTCRKLLRKQSNEKRMDNCYGNLAQAKQNMCQGQGMMLGMTTNILYWHHQSAYQQTGYYYQQPMQLQIQQ